MIAKNEFGVSFFIVNLDVSEIRMDTECDVGGQSPRSRCPSEERDGRIVDKRKRDGDCPRMRR